MVYTCFTVFLFIPCICTFQFFRQVENNHMHDSQVRRWKSEMGVMFRGSGGGAPRARKFCIFRKNNLILAYFNKN